MIKQVKSLCESCKYCLAGRANQRHCKPCKHYGQMPPLAWCPKFKSDTSKDTGLDEEDGKAIAARLLGGLMDKLIRAERAQVHNEDEMLNLTISKLENTLYHKLPDGRSGQTKSRRKRISPCDIEKCERAKRAEKDALIVAFCFIGALLAAILGAILTK